MAGLIRKGEDVPLCFSLCEACDTIETIRSWTGAPRECKQCREVIARVFWRIWERDRVQSGN